MSVPGANWLLVARNWGRWILGEHCSTYERYLHAPLGWKRVAGMKEEGEDGSPTKMVADELEETGGKSPRGA